MRQIDPDALYQKIKDVRDEIESYLEDFFDKYGHNHDCDIGLFRVGPWQPRITSMTRIQSGDTIYFYWDEEEDSPTEFDNMSTEDLIDIVRYIKVDLESKEKNN